MKKLKKIYPNFVTGDILKESINKIFDNIWLSNIGLYLSFESFKTMIDKTSRALTDDGKLLISYLYETVQNTKYQSDWNSIYNLEKTLNLLKEYNPEFVSFQGVRGIMFNDNNIKDSILVYKKIKNN